MQKICIATLNARYTHSCPALFYLREAIRDLPLLTVLKAYTVNQGLLEILNDLFLQNPRFIAFSVYIWNSDKIRALLPEIKKILPEVKIILGGPEVSYTANLWIKDFAQIDYIVSGAGEQSLRILLTKQLGRQLGRQLDEQLAEQAHQDKKIVSHPAIPLDQIPFPYREEDFKSLRNRYIYYESSRGCPFKCSYCLSSRQDMRPDYRSVKKVCQELDAICAHKPRIVKFIDRTFNACKEHYLPIWEHLIEKNPATCFHCELHAGLLTEQDFALLSKAPRGLFQFEIGIQSTNRATLQAINRLTDPQIILKNISRLIEMDKFHIHVDLIAGLPFEGWSELKNSFNDVYSLQADALQLGFLKVLPGTKMAEKSLEYGMQYMQSAPYQILQTRWMSFAEMSVLTHLESALDRLCNSHQFTKTVASLTDLYPSPFDFYEEFTLTAIKKSRTKEKKWPKIAEFIVIFVRSKHPDRLDYIVDCLRWDWCFLSNAQYYPTEISNGQDHAARKTRNRIETLLKENDLHLSRAEISSAIVYRAKTEEFRRKTGGDWVVFVKDNNLKRPIVLREK